MLLHGFGDSAAGWSQVAGPLSASRKLVAIDLAGHGPSAPITPPLAMDDILTSVEIATADLGNDLILMGNSLGGWVAMRFALAHPDRVERLILINAAGLPQAVEKDLLMPRTRARVRERNRAVFGDSPPPAPWFVCDQLIAMAREPKLESLWNNLGLEPRLDAALPALHAPATLIWGTPDPLFPEEYAERLRAALGAQEIRWLPGCGHSPQYSCPARLVELLDEGA